MTCRWCDAVLEEDPHTDQICAIRLADRLPFMRGMLGRLAAAEAVCEAIERFGEHHGDGPIDPWDPIRDAVARWREAKGEGRKD